MPKVNCAGGRWPYPHLLPSLHLHKVELDPESPTTANHHVLDGRLGRRDAGHGRRVVCPEAIQRPPPIPPRLANLFVQKHKNTKVHSGYRI